MRSEAYQKRDGLIDAAHVVAGTDLPLRVTDAHIHIQPWSMLRDDALRSMNQGRSQAEVATLRSFQDDPASFLRALDDWGIDRAVLVNYVAPETLGFTSDVNRWVSGYAGHDRDRLLPMGSVHPRLAPDAGTVRTKVEEAAATLGLTGLKLHPAHQWVWPDAYRADSVAHRGHEPDGVAYGDRLAALYQACSDHELPLLVHTGTSMFPRARNQMCNPMLLDDVATDFPDLTLVLAHAGRPLWGREAVFLARRHPRVFLDLSGIPPRSLGASVPGLAKVAHKCLWGTDWPGPGLPSGAMRSNVETFVAVAEGLGLDRAAVSAILDGNSRAIYR